MTNVLELSFPHGFLIQKGKQTSIASDVKLDIDKQFLIVSDGDAFGNVTLSEPAEMINSEFDRKQWLDKHCIFPRERRQLWPDASKLYVYPISNWKPLETPKLFVDGKIIDEPPLTATQQQIAYKGKQLPKQVLLMPDVVGVTENNEFIIDPLAQSDELEKTLEATYETAIKIGKADEFMPVYSLALVRNPRMRMAKKNESEPETVIKQEEGDMPWEIQIRDGQHCVIKIDDGEVEGCHDSRPEAVVQLAALNISEDERSIHDDIDRDPKKRKPKKEVTWVNKLKSAAMALGDLLKFAEDEKEMDFPEGMFKGDSGFAIKTIDGKPWHFTWSTNAFEDREGEIFTTKALEQYVTENEKKEHRGFFNFWHINEEDGNFSTDFAEKQWQGVWGRFLVEAGPYLDSENGQMALKFFQEFSDGHPQIAPEGWGCSPEFRYLPEERVKGIYDWLFIVRTSTLPRAAAANIWTQAKQEGDVIMATKELDPQRKESAIAIFGEEKVNAGIQDALKRSQELENAGIANKESDEPTEPVEINLDMEKLAKAVGEHINNDLGAIGEIMATLVDGLKQVTEDVVQLKKGVEAKAKTEIPRFTFNLQQASKADETVVKDDDDLKEKKPKESKTNGEMSKRFFSDK